MKLLVVDHYGGDSARRAVYRALAEVKGWEVTILVPSRWDDGFTTTRTEDGFEGAMRIAAGRTIFAGRSHRACIPKLWTLLVGNRFDILYAESEPENYQSLHALCGSKLFSSSTKVVLMSWRNLNLPLGTYPYRAKWSHAAVERTSLSKIAGLVAHNQEAKEIFLARGLRVIERIPPAVDVSRFQPLNRIPLKERLGLSEFTVGYVGRYVAEKGIDILLKASARLEFKHEIMLVGQGPEENRLRSLSRSLGIVDRVRWAGPMASDLLPQIYGAIDALVLPSHTTPLWKEQFGRVLIEAMASGVPVIASDSGELPATVGDAGLVFAEGDVGALCAQITRIHVDVLLRKKLEERGRKRVAEEFSTAKVAAMYRDFFEKVFEGKASGQY